MDNITQKERWAVHVLNGSGPERSANRTVDFNYNGRVLFSGSWPISRLVTAHDGVNFVCISRTGEFIPESWAWVKGRVLAGIRVPCIGVHTWVPGDGVAEGKELNNRLKGLWLALAHDIIDMVHTSSGYTLFESSFYQRYTKTEQEQEMLNIAAEYNNYSSLVADIDLFPIDLMDRVKSVAESRHKHYYSDNEMEKRERRAARRAARRALSV
jgi:hypothetical protein